MDPVEIFDATVSGAELIIGHKDQVASSSIRSSRVVDSRIELIGRGHRRLLLSRSSFSGCQVIGTGASGYFLDSASWTECEFRGQFTDFVFGHNPEGERIVVSECDFSQADLHIIAFRGGLDYRSCSFGGWPKVVFSRSQLDIPTLKKNGLPPRLLGIVSVGRKGHDEWLVLDVARYDTCDFDVYCMLRNQVGVFFHDAPFSEEPTQEQIAAASSKYLEQIRNHHMYRFWKWVTQSVSLTSINLLDGEALVSLKTGDSPHIPLPDSFRVRLLGLKRADLGGAGFLTQTKNRKTFRLMGASIAESFDSVSLRGHRKAMGEVSLAYQTMRIERCDGSEEPIESLSKWLD